MENQPFLSDWVRETSTSIGTGDITLLGPVATFRAFASLYTTGQKFYYTAKHRTLLEAESGIGQLTASGTIARNTILESTNSNAAVAFSAGTKDVFIAPISTMFPTLDTNEIWQGVAGGAPINTDSPTFDTINVITSLNVSGSASFDTGINVAGDLFLADGRIILADGTLAEPSLTFDSNNAVGLRYTPGSGGAIYLSVNGNDPLRVFGTSVSVTGGFGVNGETYLSHNSTTATLCTMQAAASQTGKLLDFLDSTAVSLLSVQADGSLRGNFSATIGILVVSSGINSKPLIVRGIAGQSANLLECQDSTGTALVKITALASVVLAAAALAASATDGFTYLPSCAGKPIGTPTTQTGTVPIVVDSTGKQNFIYTGGEWVCVGPTVNTVTFGIAIGTPATTGTNKTNEITLPYAGKILRARARAKSGPTGADLIFDINLNGTTIWSTQANRLKITAGGTTGSQTTFNTTTFADGDVITIDVDQVGSTIAGQDITVQLEVRKTG